MKCIEVKASHLISMHFLFFNKMEKILSLLSAYGCLIIIYGTILKQRKLIFFSLLNPCPQFTRSNSIPGALIDLRYSEKFSFLWWEVGLDPSHRGSCFTKKKKNQELKKNKPSVPIHCPVFSNFSLLAQMLNPLSYWC